MSGMAMNWRTRSSSRQSARSWYVVQLPSTRAMSSSSLARSKDQPCAPK